MEGTNMDFPPITIVATTYFPEGDEGVVRQQTFERTLKSWEQKLKYDGDIHLHVADDGSLGYGRPTYFKKTIVTYSSQHRHGIGASLNKGFRKAFETSPIVLYAVDDWALTQPFNISPWAQLLMEREDVGMVRLGPPHPGVVGTVVVYTNNWQGWGLKLNRQSYAFGHRPALYHKRMIDYYGWFREDCSAIDCEKDYTDNVNFHYLDGPDIVLALPHPWQHLESVELAYIDPKDE